MKLNHSVPFILVHDHIAREPPSFIPLRLLNENRDHNIYMHSRARASCQKKIKSFRVEMRFIHIHHILCCASASMNLLARCNNQRAHARDSACLARCCTSRLHVMVGQLVHLFVCFIFFFRGRWFSEI